MHLYLETLYEGKIKGPVIWINPGIYDTARYIVYKRSSTNNEYDTHNYSYQSQSRQTLALEQVEAKITNTICTEMQAFPNIESVYFYLEDESYNVSKLFTRNANKITLANEPFRDTEYVPVKHMALLFHYEGVCETY